MTSNPKADGSEVTAAGQVNISSMAINLEAMDYQKKDKGYTEKGLAADGKVSITAKTIEVATTNPKDITRDNKGKVTKGEYTAEGDVIIRSKTVAVETLDYEVADGKLKPKTLTKDSKIEMRSEKMGMLAADTEGKATGSISLNAKAVAVKSMDVDKEKLTDDKLAAGSTIRLSARRSVPLPTRRWRSSRATARLWYSSTVAMPLWVAARPRSMAKPLSMPRRKSRAISRRRRLLATVSRSRLPSSRRTSPTAWAAVPVAAVAA